jgi:Fe2+ transport system protein FeoA
MRAGRDTGLCQASGSTEQVLGDNNQAVDQNSHSLAAENWYALSDLPPNSYGIVREVRGDAYFTTMLASRGLAIGAQFSVLSNSGRAPLLIMVCDTCLALGHREAAWIEVELITAGDELATL